MSQEGLGRLFDVSIGVVPLDLQTARTGARVSLKHAAGATILVVKGTGTAADDPTVTLKQHTASTGGSSANLAIIDHYYLKTTTGSLAGSETWSKVTQAAAATIVDPGGAGTSAESQQIIAIEVRAEQLSDGYDYISLDVADVGTNAQLGTVIYVLHDLSHQRTPSALRAPLS